MSNHKSSGRMASKGLPNPVDVHVGARLRDLRIAQGLSQEKIAALMGVTFQQVQKYERGANRVSASRLYDLTHILNCDVRAFFEGMPDQVSAQRPGLLNGAAPNEYSAPAEISATSGTAMMRAFIALKPEQRTAVRNLMRAMAA